MKRVPKAVLSPVPAKAARWLISAAVLSSLIAAALIARSDATFHFALLGDRTGEAVPGVFEEACRAAALEKPAFFLTVGDSIQGGNDGTVSAEWKQVESLLSPYRNFAFYLAPGNHDVWSQESAAAYQRFTRRALHYGFNYNQAHFTVLNNSMNDDMPAGELEFLQSDLEANAGAPVKFIVSHRPSWIFQAMMKDPNFPLHRLAKKYGVKYVIAGHIHEMLHFEFDGVSYLCLGSSGGHLRNDKSYEHGWFFQHTLVTVGAATAEFKIEELAAPFGKSRVTKPEDWGPAGLLAPAAL